MSQTALPENWLSVKIGSLCLPVESVDFGRRISRSFQYIDISSIDREKKSITYTDRIDNTAAPSRARQVVVENDILVSTVRPGLNAVAMVPESLDNEICSTGFCVLRADATVLEPEYLFMWVQSPTFIQSLTRVERGIGYPAVNNSDVENVQIPLPPLPEQRRIVAILREADEIRKLRREVDEGIKRLYELYFQYLFGSELNNANETDFVKLKELLAVPLASGFSPVAKDTPPGRPVFTLAAITDFGLDENQVKYYPIEDYSGRGDDLEKGDILITRSNTLELVGKVARYSGRPSPVIYPDLVIRIRLKNAEDSPYVENFLRSNMMLSTIQRTARGTSGSMKKISQGDINEFKIFWPSSDRRRAYAERVKEIERQRELQTISLSRLDTLYQSLLAQAFSGKLTASWREEHVEELVRAARERDYELAGLRVEGELERITEPLAGEGVERDEVDGELSEFQKRLLRIVQEQADHYVTALSVHDEREDEQEFALDVVRHELHLLAALGRVKEVRLPVESAPGVLEFVMAYRALRAEDSSKEDDFGGLGAFEMVVEADVV